MIGLFDRDVFIKLACCNLWNEAVAALDITQPFRLNSTTSPISNRKILSRMLPGVELPPIERRLSEMVERVPTLTDELVSSMNKSGWFQRLQSIDDIDAGEQMLLAVLLVAPEERILISGDKRFFKAFAMNFPAECRKVRPQLISFEKCLEAIERCFGFNLIFERAFEVRSCDGSLKMAFGSTPNASDFRAALASFAPSFQVDDVDF